MNSCEKQTVSGFCPKDSYAFMKQEVKHNTSLWTPSSSHVYWNISSLINMMQMAFAVLHTLTTAKSATLDSNRNFLSAQQGEANMAATNIKQT